MLIIIGTQESVATPLISPVLPKLLIRLFKVFLRLLTVLTFESPWRNQNKKTVEVYLYAKAKWVEI